ncbi:TPA: morphogenetic protein [Serratia odorifera]|nr:morphogenetic protein [Serratia odorifera]
MKERPIIFNAEMVRAILDGRKMQTRRTVSDRHLHLIDVASQVGECYPLESGIDHANSQSYYREHCPFGQVGDRLWVRETFMDLTGTGIEATTGKFEGFAYRADTPAGSYGDEVRKEYGLKWTPSIHMPRLASRITLEITAVRVERLNDISQEDAQAEGMELTGWVPSYSNPDNAGFDETFTPYDNFAMLWESIYGVDGWEANPWVWVIEFRRVEVK